MIDRRVEVQTGTDEESPTKVNVVANDAVGGLRSPALLLLVDGAVDDAVETPRREHIVSNTKARTQTESAEQTHGAAVLASFRDSLDVKRREMVSLYQHDVHAGQESTDDNADDFADRANNSFNRELMFSLSANERQMLIRIDEAMKRLDEGGYGLCTYCNKPIGLPRLKAVPWASYCIDCQEREEMGLLEDG